jgi:hypothetical protein
MSSHQLVVNSIDDVGHREPTFLLGDRRVELDLVQQIAELPISTASVSSSSGSSACSASTTS